MPANLVANPRGCSLFAGCSFALCLLFGCSGSTTAPNVSSQAPTPPPSTPTIPAALQNVVFLGDSLTAGSQNGSLVDTGQEHGYPAVMAQQGGFPITLPLVATPGFQPEEQLQSTSFPWNAYRVSGATIGRENPTAQPTDLGVPGATTYDVAFATPQLNSLRQATDATGLVLGYPVGNTKSQLQEAIALQPSTVVLWIGVNDLLPYGTSATSATPNPVSSFNASLATILIALKTQTTAHLVIANIPDLTLLSAFIAEPQFVQEVAQYTGQPAASLQTELGLATGDSVNPAGLTQVASELSSIEAGNPAPALPADDVLRASQAVALQAAVVSYNQVIATLAQQNGATLVDLYSLVNSLKTGMTINGTTLTLGYLGGFYSIDGIHFTNTGYALVANQFIAAMNQGLGLSIPAADISTIAAQDPLFPSNLGAAQ